MSKLTFVRFLRQASQAVLTLFAERVSLETLPLILLLEAECEDSELVAGVVDFCDISMMYTMVSMMAKTGDRVQE